LNNPSFTVDNARSWRLFDVNGDGEVNTTELSEAMRRMAIAGVHDRGKEVSTGGSAPVASAAGAMAKEVAAVAGVESSLGTGTEAAGEAGGSEAAGAAEGPAGTEENCPLPVPRAPKTATTITSGAPETLATTDEAPPPPVKAGSGGHAADADVDDDGHERDWSGRDNTGADGSGTAGEEDAGRDEEGGPPPAAAQDKLAEVMRMFDLVRNKFCSSSEGNIFRIHIAALTAGLSTQQRFTSNASLSRLACWLFFFVSLSLCKKKMVLEWRRRCAL
jgi:hypothetical protein